MRPDRSTRSRKASFPISRRPMTRPATRSSSSIVAPFSARSATARTAATPTRSGNLLGSILLPSLGCFDLEDLELHRAARGRDLDGLALLLADDRLADRRLVRELVLRRVRLGGTDDLILERLVRADVAEPDGGADRDDVGGDLRLVDDTG